MRNQGMTDWTHERMKEWSNKWINDRMKEWVNAWTNGERQKGTNEGIHQGRDEVVDWTLQVSTLLPAPHVQLHVWLDAPAFRYGGRLDTQVTLQGKSVTPIPISERPTDQATPVWTRQWILSFWSIPLYGVCSIAGLVWDATIWSVTYCHGDCTKWNTSGKCKKRSACFPHTDHILTTYRPHTDQFNSFNLTVPDDTLGRYVLGH